MELDRRKILLAVQTLSQTCSRCFLFSLKEGDQMPVSVFSAGAPVLPPGLYFFRSRSGALKPLVPVRRLLFILQQSPRQARISRALSQAFTLHRIHARMHRTMYSWSHITGVLLKTTHFARRAWAKRWLPTRSSFQQRIVTRMLNHPPKR